MSICFPRRCPVCGGIVQPEGALICPLCQKTLQYVQEPYCLHCGKPLRKPEREFCGDCMRRKLFWQAAGEPEKGFDRSVAVFTYRSAGAGLLDMKYRNRREYALFYAAEAARIYRELICMRWKPQALLPVPIHRTRRRERGYNQAELLAERLGVLLDIPVRADLLMRVKRTLPQRELDAGERLLNLREAFALAGETSGIETVLLVDDIYTTGSTLEAIARILKRAGVQKVYCLCMAIGEDIRE